MEDTRLYMTARFHARRGREHEVIEALREEVPQARVEEGCVKIDAFFASSGSATLLHSLLLEG